MDWQQSMSSVWTQLGSIREARGNPPGAEEAYAAVLAIWRHLTNGDPFNVCWQRELAASWSNVARIRDARRDLPGVLEAQEAGLAVRKSLARLDPANAVWRRDQVRLHLRIADALDGTARAVAASAHRSEAHGVLLKMRDNGIGLDEEEQRVLDELDARFGGGGACPETPRDA